MSQDISLAAAANAASRFVGKAVPLLAAAAGIWMVQWAIRWYRVRTMIRGLQGRGIPIMPHSLVWGHLLVVQRLLASGPRDVHINYLVQIIQENWETLFPGQSRCPPVVYVDMWPLAPPMAFTIDPEVASQFLYNNTLPKAEMANMFMKPLTENLDIVSSEGTAWKTWRARLQPGFSPKNIISLVPAIMDEVAIFAAILRDKAGENGDWGGVFPLEDLTTNLTMDVISRAVLDVRLHEQTAGPSVLRKALLHQLSLCMFDFNIITIWSWMSPRRALAIARNTRIMRDYLVPFIQRRISEDETGDRKTVVDLALKTFRDEPTDRDKPQPEQQRQPDAAFVNVVVSQLKAFLFAGHDTTATSICWALHTLAKNPEARDRVRAEHDAVLGPTAATEARLRASPHLLNSLPYTLAVLKETLRLYPVVGPIRDGRAGTTFSVSGRGSDNVPREWPTEGFMVWDGVRAGTRSPGLWARPNEFFPERWLVTDASDPLCPPKNAWRPFGLGPRNCIGQELAMVEMKLVLVLVMRELEVDCAWDIWDVMKRNRDKPAIDGERCYQVGLGTPHVKDGMPVHVRIRSADKLES